MDKEITYTEALTICQHFANKHKIVFDEEGECGFGRECVGFRHGDNWVDYNPHKHDSDHKPIPEFYDEGLRAPSGVNAYHKHNCLAVLGRGEDAVISLAKWVKYLESLGKIKIERYETGAKGLQAIISGVFGHTIAIKKSKCKSNNLRN